jgi:hypothetical protein
MHAIKQLALLAAVSLCAAAPHFVAAQTKAPPREPEVLFVQSANGVAFKDGVLSLKDVSPTTIFFADRPERAIGHVRNDMFLKLWTEGKNSFKADPPNASLSFFDRTGGRPALAVVELSNPRADGKNPGLRCANCGGHYPDTGRRGHTIHRRHGCTLRSHGRSSAYGLSLLGAESVQGTVAFAGRGGSDKPGRGNDSN